MQDDQKEKSKLALNEEKILDYWEKNDIFKKSLNLAAPKGDFVFYDGPPFATGEPHYGHVVPGTIKDIIPRYKTMRGFRVRRRWGWDCHGLPVENIIEKELKLESRKDILTYGIEKFNAKARESVMRYADDWRRIIPRLGRWVDMDDDYRTMDASYTESVWWAFSELYKKGLIYEGFKSMHLCPRCETTLSNFEVTQGYKDITDISVYVKFELEKKEGIEEGTFLLAWTTTPWTLPGNAALAINPEIKYVKIEIENIKYILAESRLSVIKQQYKTLEEIPTKNLIGASYKPLFDYYLKDKSLKNKENGWKIYGADFVTTDDGTGVVHIAPAFGTDDYELSLKHKIPFIQHVATNGVFKDEVTDFKGQHVKAKDTPEDKDAHQRGDIEIIKYLAAKNLLFAKEKIIHSYPHCWRCDTPLLNYSTSSWFVKVTEIRDKLVKENKKIEWVPEEVGEGRFGNWLLGARDWAISRSRFWGAPLPVWKDEKTGECVVIGSIEDLKKHSKAKNTYFVMRHGEAENNEKNIVSSRSENAHHLTQKGKEQTRKGGEWLKDKKIDMIFASPFARTRETAEIVAKTIGFDPKKIVVEKRLHEIDAGILEGKKFEDFLAFVNSILDRYSISIPEGENYIDIQKRMGEFIYDLEKKNQGKNILIVTHDTPALLLRAVAEGLGRKEVMSFKRTHNHYLENAKPFKLDFHPLPHNDEYELDLHRPYIDDIFLTSKDGNRLVRIPEVFDCWFESGSMPFGEAHYPFSKEDFNPKPGPFSKILGKTKGYPADFIAEGLDQTRGWFYSMLVLGVALFGRSPYKSVIVNGLVLAEDGRKMSKREKNYPDVSLVINKYGADALRYFLMSSPVVRAQDVCFTEKGVDEVAKKHIGRLNNVLSFYEMYAGKGEAKEIRSEHPLDIWIQLRLQELGREITRNLEKYEIDRAARPIADFIDDLSTWYIRRSRDRFKSEDVKDKEASLSTTRDVLLEFSKLLAPFMPFLAEDIYLKLKGPKESVHLDSWGDYEEKESKEEATILSDMREIRKLSSLGLEARMKAKINVRQPLGEIKVKAKLPENEALLSILKDEINVKKITSDSGISEEVILDTVLTPELKEEGQVRELLRAIQDMRKEKGFTIEDRLILKVETNDVMKDLIEKNKKTITQATLLNDIRYENVEGEAVVIGENSLKIKLGK